jgi:hypothetical protein
MDVARHLGKLTLELDDLVKKLEIEEDIWVELKRVHLTVYGETWLGTSGIAESRKQETILATMDQWYALEVCEKEMRKLQRRIKALEKRISVGQSYGATVRAEVALAGSSFQQYA